MEELLEQRRKLMLMMGSLAVVARIGAHVTCRSVDVGLEQPAATVGVDLPEGSPQKLFSPESLPTRDGPSADFEAIGEFGHSARRGILVPADYIDRPQSSPVAIYVRLLNDITDEETELLDEDLLDLIAAGQS